MHPVEQAPVHRPPRNPLHRPVPVLALAALGLVAGAAAAAAQPPQAQPPQAQPPQAQPPQSRTSLVPAVASVEPSVPVETGVPVVTSTPPPLCPDAPPPDGTKISATGLTMTFSFHAHNANTPPEGCTWEPRTTVVVRSTDPDGTVFRRFATSATAVADGTLTVVGLTPGVDYYYWFTGGGSPFSSPVTGPVRTVGRDHCARTALC